MGLLKKYDLELIKGKSHILIKKRASTTPFVVTTETWRNPEKLQIVQLSSSWKFSLPKMIPQIGGRQLNSFVLAVNHRFVCCYDCNQYWHLKCRLDSRTGDWTCTSCALPNFSDSFFSATTADLGTLHKKVHTKNSLFNQGNSISYKLFSLGGPNAWSSCNWHWIICDLSTIL